MRVASRLAVALAVLFAAATARAQEWTSQTTVVGFSADGKSALLRYQVHAEGNEEEPDTITLARFDLAKQKVTQRDQVVSVEDIVGWHKAHPKGTPAELAKAMTRLRGDHWTAAEGALKAAGYKIDPAYKEQEKEGATIEASFMLPDKAQLKVDYKVNEDGDQLCDLVVRRGAKKGVLLPQIYKQMPSLMSMSWIEKVYLDPKKAYVIAIERFAGIKGFGDGLRAIPMADVEKALK